MTRVMHSFLYLNSHHLNGQSIFCICVLSFVETFCYVLRSWLKKKMQGVRRDDFGNQVQKTDDYENQVQNTDEYGKPVHQSGAGMHGTKGGVGGTDKDMFGRTGAGAGGGQGRRSGGSSSSEDDEQGGRRKKGLKDKIKESLPGGHKTGEPGQTGYGGGGHKTAEPGHTGCGVGGHKTAEPGQTGYGVGGRKTAEPGHTGYGGGGNKTAEPGHTGYGQEPEKKGFVEKIKEKLPGQH